MYTKIELCKNAGITPETLRHYVDIGLINPKEITEKGYRKYDRDNILDLWFYRLGASLGNPLKEVKKWNTAMSMEHFQGQLKQRETQLERTIEELGQQLIMIREIRHYVEKEQKAEQVVTKEPGLAGYRAFCDSGLAAQRQNWREIYLKSTNHETTCMESRLGICVMKEQFDCMGLAEKDGLEEMPAMNSLCMFLVTSRPFQLGWKDFLPILDKAAKGYVLHSGIIGSLFCREVAKVIRNFQPPPGIMS